MPTDSVTETLVNKSIDGRFNTLQLEDDSISNAMLADMVQSTIKGRAAGAGTGDPQDLTGTQAGAIIVDMPTAGLADDAVTNAKLANMAQSTLKGRASGAGTGDPTDLTGAQVAVIIGLDIVSGGRTYFIKASGGSDSNDGLSLGNAWATGQKAADVLETLYIPVGDVVIFDCQDGTHTGPGGGTAWATIAGWSGGGQTRWEGNLTTPGNCLIDADGSPCWRISNGARLGGGMSISGFQLIGGPGGHGVRHAGNGVVGVSVCEFSEANMLLQVEYDNAVIDTSGECAIVGGVTIDRCFDADVGYIQDNANWTIAGNIGVTTAFAIARNRGFLLSAGNTYTVSGSCTGKRYSADKSGGIDTQARGHTFYPGDSAGTVETGGEYDGYRGIVSGTVTFAASTTASVSLPFTQPDTTWDIYYASGADNYFWTTSRTTTGFTANAKTSTSETITWTLIRRP